MPASLTCPNGHPIPSTDKVCPLCGTLPHPEPVPLPTDPVLPAVPGYEVLGLLGQGGMGVVYRGRHVRLGRVVALKMIRDSGFASPDGVNRFRAEAEAVARLQHPNIVQIYEVGEHAGRPYCALEFVDGGSLADRLAHTPQPARYAAAVVQALARAVHHAHQQGIVHRDLKPANVLLTRQGTPKVTDFGLVKRLDDASGQTATGAILGTPSYMAPEQAAGRTRDIGPRVDVYALGAILYEMLTGRPPFSGSSALDTLEQVRSREPVPPRQLNPAAPHDLETICLKCLQKDPARRYGNGDELANDLRRFLGGEPIEARPVGRAERLWRWARRNPAVAGLAVTVVLALLAGTVVSTCFALQARHRARDAEDAAERTGQEKLRADENARQANWRAYVSDMQRIGHEWEYGRIGHVRALLDGQRPERTGDKDLRGFEWHFWDHLCRGEVLTFRGHRTPVVNVAFSPDGKRLASVGSDYTTADAIGEGLKVWEADTGRVLLTLPGVNQMAFSPDGKWLAAPREKEDFPLEVAIWDASTGREARRLTLPRFGVSSVYTMAFSPDSKLLAVRGGYGTVIIWDRTTGKEVHTLHGHLERVRCMVFRPDGTELATSSDDGMVRIWNVATGRCQRAFTVVPSGVAWAVAYSPDGQSLATGGDDPRVKVRDAASGRERLSLRGHSSTVCCVAFSPDGRRLVSGGYDQTVRVWDAEGGDELWCFRGHTGPIRAIAFGPDGRRLASCGEDGTVKLWEAVGGPAAATLKCPGDGPNAYWGGAAYSPDGRRVALVSADGIAHVYDAECGAECLALTVYPPSEFPGSERYSPDGRFFATGGAGEKAARLWDAETGRALLTGPTHSEAVVRLAFAPDSKWLASVSLLPEEREKARTAATVKIWSTADGQERCSLLTGEPVSSAAFSPDGRLLATGGGEGWRGAIGMFQNTLSPRIRLWDTGNGREQRSFSGHSDTIYALAFSPDGRWLASASADRTVKIWAVASGKELLTLQGHAGAVSRVQFSADGARLASSGWNDSRQRGETIVWDTASGQPVLIFDEFFQTFSPDGRRMLTLRPRSASIWDLTPFAEDHGDQREAVPLFRYYLEKLWLKEEVLQAIRQDGTARAPVRQRALALAERYRELPARLNAQSWRVVRSATGGADVYRLALRQAEAASRLEPTNADYLITLGAAYYRVSQAVEAVQTLTRANALHLGRPSGLAFLAMAQKRLGQNECLTTLNRFQEDMNKAPAYRDREARDLLAEARAVILNTRTHVLEPESWHVVGPFAKAARDTGLDTEFPPEKGVDLGATYAGKSSTVAWQTLRADIRGYVDLLPSIPDSSNVITYAYCRVESPADQEVTVFLGTDDCARLWVNGTPVYTNPNQRSRMLLQIQQDRIPDEDLVRLRLAKGRNAILLKITNYDGAYGFYLRFESPHELKEVP
jgi:WD40 repeat protein